MATLAQATKLANDEKTRLDVISHGDKKKLIDSHTLHIQVLTDELASITAIRDALQAEYDAEDAALPQKFLDVMNSA